MDIKTLWENGGLEDWEDAVSKYYNAVKPNNIEVEQKLNAMTADEFKQMSGQEFYRFLVGDYSSWKYTDNRRKATVRHNIEDFHQKFTDDEFKKILDAAFLIDKGDIFLHFANMTRITGIGTAGASGVLSLIFPKYFGTVDRFLVENLKKIYDGQSYYGKKLQSMNPDSFTIYDAITLTQILRKKAEELNKKFKTDKFTPRKIDMALWAVR